MINILVTLYAVFWHSLPIDSNINIRNIFFKRIAFLLSWKRLLTRIKTYKIVVLGKLGCPLFFSTTVKSELDAAVHCLQSYNIIYASRSWYLSSTFEFNLTGMHVLQKLQVNDNLCCPPIQLKLQS